MTTHGYAYRGFLRRRDPQKADEAEAGSMRNRIAALLRASEDAKILAEWMDLKGGAILARVLKGHIDHYKESAAWIEPNLRELGKAERSKEILRYLEGALDRAVATKAEAERLASLLEQHEKSGRIRPEPKE